MTGEAAHHGLKADLGGLWGLRSSVVARESSHWRSLERFEARNGRLRGLGTRGRKVPIQPTQLVDRPRPRLRMATQILFVGVARDSDHALVACHPPNHPAANGAVAKMLGTLEGMEDGRLYSFSVAQSAWHLVLKEGLIYLINTALDYPPSVASQVPTTYPPPPPP